MKKLKLFALGLIGATFLFTTSCEEDEDAPNPVLSVSEAISGSTGTVTVAPNTDIELSWNARKEGSGAELKTFAISVQGVNVVNPIPQSVAGNDFPYSISNSDDDQYIDKIALQSGANIGITTWTFTVTDKDGKSASASITVDVQSATTPLATEVMGAFFHIEGSEHGAYDLVSGASVAASGSDADKDMINTDAAGDPFTGSWMSGTGNNTTFVKVTGFDYDNATVESAMAAYNGGTSSSSVVDPVAGDIYVALLRGGSDYAVIKVTKVDPADNTCNCGNTGIIEFDYKKN